MFVYQRLKIYKHIYSVKHNYRDFPAGPVVKTLPSNAGGAGLIPSWGAKIPHAWWPKTKNIKKKQY